MALGPAPRIRYRPCNNPMAMKTPVGLPSRKKKKVNRLAPQNPGKLAVIEKVSDSKQSLLCKDDQMIRM